MELLKNKASENTFDIDLEINYWLFKVHILLRFTNFYIVPHKDAHVLHTR